MDKIAFTGSTEVGRLIRKATAGTGKSLTLELGGKSPFIVFDDADLDGAVEGVVDAIWFNQGQVCCAGSRLLVQEGVAAEFIKRLKRRMGKLRVGHPLDKAIDMGAIIDPIQLKRIGMLVDKGVAEGAEKFQPEITLPATGCFFPPTLLTNVETSSTVATEEIFGPVLVSMTFRTPDEAVMLANNSRYGLSASVWSETIGLALDIAPKLQCGVVWVNATNLFDAAVGFGGYRESGFGREGGREGIYEYLKLKAWAARKPKRFSGVVDRSGCEGRISMNHQLTARQSFSSAASRRGPMEIIRAQFFRPPEKLSVKWAKAIARTFAMRSRRRAERKAGRRPRRITGRKFSITWRKTSRRGPMNLRVASRR